MENLEFKNYGVAELSHQELQETEGGFIGLIGAYILQAAVVGSLAAGVYASYQAGYSQTQ